jgi:hypothetical protein
MNRWTNLKSALLAGAFFALGFLVADRMTNAGANSVPVAQDGNGAAFSGTDGAVVVKTHLLVFRGRKIYKIDPLAPGGAQRPWGEIGD